MDWEWDVDQYPEYPTILSRNGFYSPSAKHSELRPTIRRLHFESIRKAADHRAMDPRTSKGHSPEVLRHIEKELGRRLPDTLRGVRELDPASAAELDRLLPPAAQTPRRREGPTCEVFLADP